MRADFRIPLWTSALGLFVLGACEGPTERDRPSRLVLDPPGGVVLYLDSAQQYTPYLISTGGDSLPVTAGSVTWTVSPASLAEVTPNGLLTARALGEGEVRARVGTTQGSARFEVRAVPTAPTAPTVHRVSLGADGLAIPRGSSAQLTVTLWTVDSVELALGTRTVEWSAWPDSVVLVSSSGLVTAVGEGAGMVRAVVDSVEGLRAILVWPPPPPPFAGTRISPSPLLLAVADTATVRWQGIVNAISGWMTYPASGWSSDNPAVATIAADGLVRAIGAGTTTLRGTYGGYAATGTVTVTPPDGPWAALSDVDMGHNYTCGLLVGSGEVLCWGDGAPWPSTTRGTMRTLTGASGFSAIAVSFWSVCGLEPNGQAQCRHPSPSGVWATFAPERTWRTIRFGYSHGCGIASDSTAYCWGTNSFGELGNGTTSLGSNEIVPVAGPKFLAIAGGWNRTCGITTDSTAVCWGAGPVGDGTSSMRLVPTPVDVGEKAVAIAVGYTTACLLTPAGDTWCWGNNYAGALGGGSTNDQELSAVRTTDFPTATSVIVGGSTCVLTGTGSVHCAGWLPGPTGTFPSFTKTRAGRDRACGIAADASTWCWGTNEGGSLGDGTTTPRSSPVRVRLSYDP